MYTNSNVEDRYILFKTWCWTRQSSGQPYLRSDDTEAFEQLDPIAERYGDALSSWDRAARELGIKLRKPITQLVPIPRDFEAQINTMSSTQLRERLTKDKSFSDLYGRWSAGEKPEGDAADETAVLTAQQWRSLPPNTAAMKMHDPTFRAQVDRLIARGEI